MCRILKEISQKTLQHFHIRGETIEYKKFKKRLSGREATEWIEEIAYAKQQEERNRDKGVKKRSEWERDEESVATLRMEGAVDEKEEDEEIRDDWHYRDNYRDNYRDKTR